MPPPASTSRIQTIQAIFTAYDQLAFRAYRQTGAEAKADGTTVTGLDRDASRMVTDALQAHQPDYGILSEEEDEALLPQAEWRWVVDPLDGTASFARGFPVWGLGIGLMQGAAAREGYLRFPALDETYAFDGTTLTCNGKPAQPPAGRPLADTEHFLIDSSLHKWLTGYGLLLDFKLRGFGSNLYHMAAMAMGRSEGMICGRVYLWDLAAALPMTRARGLVERFVDGGDFDPGELTAETGYRLRGPLIISTPERIETLVDGLRGLLRA